MSLTSEACDQYTRELFETVAKTFEFSDRERRVILSMMRISYVEGVCAGALARNPKKDAA